MPQLPESFCFSVRVADTTLQNQGGSRVDAGRRVVSSRLLRGPAEPPRRRASVPSARYSLSYVPERALGSLEGALPGEAASHRHGPRPYGKSLTDTRPERRHHRVYFPSTATEVHPMTGPAE